MKTFTSGAKSSEEAPRYDLLEPAFLARCAARMAQGAASHGTRNYRNGAHDDAFVQDRLNHLVGHAIKLAAGDTSEDHLGAVAANANILAALFEIRMATVTNTAMMTYDDKRAAAGPCGLCGKPLVMNPCKALPCAFDRAITKPVMTTVQDVIDDTI
jgi:hypothetical protein